MTTIIFISKKAGIDLKYIQNTYFRQSIKQKSREKHCHFYLKKVVISGLKGLYRNFRSIEPTGKIYGEKNQWKQDMALISPAPA